MAIKIFVGTSPGTDDEPAEKVLEYSLRKFASEELDIHFMRKDSTPFYSGFDTSQWYTPFSSLRWTIPEQCNFEGRAIYMDVDQLNLKDIAEFYNMDMDGAPFACRKGGRTCVMLLDNEKMKDLVDPLDVIKKRADYSAYAYQKFTPYGVEYDPRWNCLDGEGRNPFDIWHLHFTNMSTQPWRPAWGPEIHKHHNIPFEHQQHPRVDLAALWEWFLFEAVNNDDTVMASSEYKKLLEMEHEKSGWGVMAANMIDTIRAVIDKYNPETILDYGAGQGGFKRALNDPTKDVREYDIGIPELSARPEPAEFVVCIDVLEHVELNYVENVLKDLARVTQKAGYFNVSTAPAQRKLSDGRNAHVTVRPSHWWTERLSRHFHIVAKSKDEVSVNYEVIPK